MQLLKLRDFSAMFTDTFQFVKENAAHYFLNFFIINGLFILLYSGFYSFVMPNLENGTQTPLTVLYIAVVLVLAIVYWVFSPIYMLLYQQTDGNFNYTDILKYITGHAGKISIYLILSIFMGIVLGVALVLIAILLFITIVGIVALPILFSAFALWFQLTFMEYLNSEKSYFDALGYAFTMLTKNFAATVISNALIQLIILIFYYLAVGAFGLFAAFSEMGTNQVEALEKMQQFMSSPIMMIIVSLMLIASSIVYINAGISYFSQKEQLENIAAHSSIDEIGRE